MIWTERVLLSIAVLLCNFKYYSVHGIACPHVFVFLLLNSGLYSFHHFLKQCTHQYQWWKRN